MLEAFRMRMYFFLALVSLTFAVLLIQLVNLQIIQGKEYKQKSKLNMENNIPIPASRGEIFDRNFRPDGRNTVFVTNRPSFNITTIRARFRNEEQFQKTMKDVSKILKISYQDFMDSIEGTNPWQRALIKEDVSFETIVKVATHQNRFPNVDWEDAPVRVYNYGSMFAHAVGYIGAISPDEYKVMKNIGYKHYQKVGKAGLEKEYDILLRGADGYIRRIVDVRNRTEGEEIGLEPAAGNNLVLTIDYEVQKTAFEAMKDTRGAAIVMKPSTGEILALVSKPDFDPNMVISKDNSSIIKELSADKYKPFLDRAIQSRYPPASTFKIVTAIAALEEEKFNPSMTFFCGGKYTLKGYTDRDFYCYESHGTLDMYWGIARSCSAYFYQLGYKIGPTIIFKYANYFGLGEKTGIEIPGEIAGFIPSKKWKLKTYGQPWFDGDTINLSIGQGFILVTPIEMANLLSGVVNDGIIYKPFLVREIRSPDNASVIRKFKPEKIREIPLSPVTLNTIKQGMRLGVKSGTSGRLGVLKVQVAGKTGTAQTRSRRKEDYSQHAWFIGYAPFNGPADNAIVVVVLVEYGIAGAVAAVPVAEQIFTKLTNLGYF